MSKQLAKNNYILNFLVEKSDPRMACWWPVDLSAFRFILKYIQKSAKKSNK